MTFPSSKGSSYADSILGLVLVPLVWVFIGVRLYVRQHLAKRLGWDDITCVLVGIIYTVEYAAIMMVNDESSRFGANPSEEQLILISKWYLVAATTYAIASFLVKLTIALGFLRILQFRFLDARTRNEWRITIVVIVLSFAVNIGLFFMLLFRCSGVMPTELAAAIVHGRCGLDDGVKAFTYTAGGVNILTDFILVLLPIPSIMKTKMDRKTRDSIFLILLIGISGTLASIVRIPFIYTFYLEHPATGAVGSMGSIWSNIEIATFLIFGCLSTFHPLLVKFFPSIVQNSNTTGFDDSGTGLKGSIASS